MFSFLRAPLPPKTNRVGHNPIIYEDGASSLEFREAGADYLLINKHPPFDKERPSIMVPPFHYHIHQAEHFRIRSGACHLFKGTADGPWKSLSADDPNALKTAIIPKGTYHTIHNASTTEPVVLDVNLSPEDFEGEQRFFRNFFGYLDDCRKANQSPSLFQLMVFLKAADTPLALPMPAEWLGRVVSRVFTNLMGFWGKWALGYKDSYAEYYQEKKHV